MKAKLIILGLLGLLIGIPVFNIAYSSTTSQTCFVAGWRLPSSVFCPNRISLNAHVGIKTISGIVRCHGNITLIFQESPIGATGLIHINEDVSNCPALGKTRLVFSN